MAVASVEPFFTGETGRNTRGLLRLIILCTIAGAAVASRLFSVISTISSVFPMSVHLLLSLRFAEHSLTLQIFRIREHHPRMLVYPLLSSDTLEGIV